jgi:hypothetical protein
MVVQDRVRRILGDLEAVRENLLGLSDDIWLSIEHNDPQALEEGVQFKRAYNEKMAEFNRLATDLSVLIQQFTSVRLESEEKTGFDSERENERIIAELNREEPHTIDEDFMFKRPHGYMLRGQATTGITTWPRLFELFCKQLLRQDGDRFRQLPENPNFISRRGHPSFSRSPEGLRMALQIGDGIFAEANYSANGIRDVVRDLLGEFAIPVQDLKLYLRQDRDAGDGEGQ